MEYLHLLSNDYAILVLLGLLALLVALVLIAFAQGREISFWPPRIGGKPKSITVDQKTIDLSGGKTTALSYEKQPYFTKLSVHCANCGNEIIVTNPRPHIMPSKIEVDVSSTMRGGIHDYIKTGCTKCAHRQYIQLEYRDKK
ncbi:hypothetical protein KA005_48040 [bacterium]|nr:hypothetical protein [bacterium]